MKKPILYHMYRILGCVLLVGSVLVFITGNIAGGAGVVLTGLSLIGVAEIACYLAETAYNTARTADILDVINTRELRRETAERHARAVASIEAAATPEMSAESDRIRRETRARAGL